MSRIGKNPVTIPSGVTIDVSENTIKVKGTRGELSRTIDPRITAKVEDGKLIFERTNEEKQTRAMHGLYRSLVQNMVEGVSNGYKTHLELVGVGYKAEAKGQILELNLGYSHAIFLQVPKEIAVSAEMLKGQNPKVTLESSDKELLGHITAKIRSLRKVEPYKGKGVRFVGEQVRRKAGKSAGK
ncbi:ribosomal protein L6, bacterial type [Bernardetia litoralis DSM 6794]|uniref:Large ribosomal subunit protein uL6 n=1 Tax=Bernardetia litoralis (strain ATCC 23117 / DSM 6794 / NBRC 15988 / NCIMB 1366 / Fx l1 / Sio-4) TaxID=880071 RepID=I4ALV2_BERLS|nr:50S ribosomal protein L6 [Bernardetia litoralis]AFM04937.1 ribosomal protein L6, bacterial type [Bernardetia litoralis DSM 6794]